MTDNSEIALRPADWDSYVGQKKLKERLQVSINGAMSRGTIMDHVLLVGGPGMGKTSLASLIAQESMEEFHSFVAPLKPKVLTKIFLERPGVIFIDEVHRQPVRDQEFLLPILEDYKVVMENGEAVPIEHPMVVVAATTNLNKLIEPLRDRFTHKPKFDDYTDEEMATIITRMADRLDIKLPKPHALALGKASAGTPRQARGLLFVARDLGTTNPAKVLEMAGITEDGLTEDHVAYLKALDRLTAVTNRAGVDKIANMTGQPKDILVDLEKLLLDRNYIDYTQTGRQLNVKGMKLVKSL